MKRTISLLSILFLFLLFISSLSNCAGGKSAISSISTEIASPQPKTYDSQALEHFMAGESFTLQGDYAMAALEYQDALQYDTTSSTIYLSLGKAYLNLGKFDRGAFALKKAIQRNPSDQEAREILAQVLFLTGKTKDAQREYEILAKERPDDPEIQFQIAAIYLKNNQPDRALKVYTAVFTADSSRLDAMEKAAEVAFLQKDFKQAANYFDILIKQAPDNIDYLKGRSDLAIMNGDLNMAIDLTKQALTLDPQNYTNRQRLGDILSRSDRFEEADSYLRMMIESYPDSIDGYENLSLVLVRQQRYSNAVDFLRIALEKFPSFPVFLMLQGSCYFSMKNYTLAEPPLATALQIEPQNLQAQHMLANVWDTVGKYELADSLYNEIIQNNPDDDVALNNHAYSLAVRGVLLEEALNMIGRALQKEPENSSYLDTKGWILYKLGKFKEALPWVEKSLGTENENSEVLEHLGDIHKSLNNSEKAQEFYRRALKIDSENERLKQKLVTE
ncbi:MAG: tetratricopeptide repeat protein [Candidatus Marinimicrobia bacterium]|nr:tetratricopeptide repeat protein [Candidatus Neomarinimicrobiota bacterium]